MSNSIAKAALNLAQQNSAQLNDIIQQDLPLKADKSYVDTKTASLASGSPKGTYSTLVALQTAFPSGTTGIYVVTADGGWYYWSGSAWTKGGTYQSTGIADKAVRIKNLNDSIAKRELIESFTFADYNSAFAGSIGYVLVHDTPLFKKGIVSIDFKTIITGDVTFFLLEKDGLNFKIVNKQTFTSVVAGVNNVETDFYSNGEGYYIGFLQNLSSQWVYGANTTDYYISTVEVTQTIGSIFTTLLRTNATFPIGLTVSNLNVILGDNSVGIQKLDNALIETTSMATVDVATPTSSFAGSFGYLVAPAIPLSKSGKVSLTLKAAKKATLTIYLLENNNNNCTVKQTDTINVVAGVQEIKTNLKCSGNGNEYVGFLPPDGVLMYSAYDGKNKWLMSSTTLPTLNVNDTFAINTKTNSTFAISVSVYGFITLYTPANKPLAGTTVVTFGDSLTEGDLGLVGGSQAGLTAQPWPKTLADVTGATVINKAKCGTTVKEQYATAKTVDYTNVDFVTIMIGTNGGVGSSTIADIQNVSDYTLYPDTYYGNYGGMIEYILAQKSSIRIYLICPPFAGTLNRATGFIENVRVAVKEIAGFYNLPLIDVYGEIGINKKTYQYYLCDDQVHFKQAAYNTLGKYVARQIQSK